METTAAKERTVRGVVRTLPWPGAAEEERERLLMHEWLVTNALGGYSSGTVSGVITRRYHGILVAALPAEFGRMVMLTDLAETLLLPGGRELQLGGEERVECLLRLHGACNLSEFRLEGGLPVWRYEFEGCVVEKRIFMPHRQNTVYIDYRVLAGEGEMTLLVRPAMNFRPHEAPVSAPLPPAFATVAQDGRYEFSATTELPRLRMAAHGDAPAFTFERRIIREVIFRTEESRGYDARGDLWSPGYFRIPLAREKGAALVASTENWETVLSMTPEEALSAEEERRQALLDSAPAAREPLAAELVLAADQFIMSPPGRREDAAKARAAGEQLRSVVAGYHWFTDWGRDTMISLEGLTLLTGRHLEAGWILKTFAKYVSGGLIPNMFPEGEKKGLYNTADATLWFFHAVDRYLAFTGDRSLLALLLPELLAIAGHHRKGTLFSIGVDPADGLLRQGEEGFALTWMDAKAGEWVVTPRRGKAVEINALWYNALRLLERWVAEERGEGEAAALREEAERVRRSFNEKFWFPQGGYLYDVVEGTFGNDPSLRPNQILAVSLKHPVLDEARWAPVVGAVREALLTPAGLRSLAPAAPGYKAKYYGDRLTRDAAYHQGTVWAWLIGPFIDAWLRLYPQDIPGARRFLEGFGPHLSEAGIGTVSEIFDAEPPFTPRGCVAQAWSVAEVLRALVKTSG